MNTHATDKTIKMSESHDNEILIITLSSPENHNALTSRSIAELRRALREEARDKRGVLLKSEVTGYFCLGMDLKFLTRQMEKQEMSPSIVMERINDYVLFLQELLALPCLIMAEVDGVVVGGGVDILGGCDIVFASHDSAFSVAQLRNRIFPLTSSAMTIPIIGKNAFLYWCLSGQNYSARRVQQLGLITQSLPQEDLAARSSRFLDQLCSYDKNILQLGIRSVRQSQRMKQTEYLSYLSAQLTHNCLIWQR